MFKTERLGFRVHGAGFRVQGLGFGVYVEDDSDGYHQPSGGVKEAL